MDRSWPCLERSHPMSEMFQYFPTAVYGKSGDSGKVPEGYRWLERSSDFPDSAYDWADKYAKSFQWVSNASKSLYEPVTAWVPLDGREGGGLFFQFLDAGDDDRGRPHTLKMKAAYVPPESIKDNPDLLLFLLASSQGIELDAPVAGPLAIATENNNRLEEFRAALRQANLDLADHAVLLTTEPDTFSLRPPHSFTVFNRNSWSLIKEIPAVHKENHEIQIKRTSQETRKTDLFHKTIQSQSKKITYNKLLTKLSFVINIILALTLILCCYNDEKVINKLQNIINNQKNTIDNYENKLNKIQKRENEYEECEKIKNAKKEIPNNYIEKFINILNLLKDFDEDNKPDATTPDENPSSNMQKQN